MTPSGSIQPNEPAEVQAIHSAATIGGGGNTSPPGALSRGFDGKVKPTRRAARERAGDEGAVS